MIIRWIGAILIVAGCGSFGLFYASSHRRAVLLLRQLICSIEYMERELKYRQLPIPDLLRQTAAISNNGTNTILGELALELDKQTAPDIVVCMENVLNQHSNLPKQVVEAFILLGNGMGHFNLDGQLESLQNVRNECQVALLDMSHNQDVRLRNYQTLALCAGAAVVILLI